MRDCEEAEEEGREEDDWECGGGESEPESKEVTESMKSWNICVSMNWPRRNWEPGGERIRNIV